MSKVRTTVTLDEEVLRWVKVRAARLGKRDGEVIEQSLRRDRGLDQLERLWQRGEVGEAEAMRLAVEGQHKTRRKRKR